MEDMIPQGGSLALLLASGYTITHAEAEGAGGWFADLRDPHGRVHETGLGPTQAEALAHLAERTERMPQPAAAPAIMHDHLTALLAAGYSVELTPAGDRVKALVELLDEKGNGAPDRNWLAIEDTAAAAIWTASPLHDDERMPKITDLIAEASEGFGDVLGIFREEVNVVRKVKELSTEVTGLSGEVSDAFDRLDALEADRDGRERNTSILIRTLADLHGRAFPEGHVSLPHERLSALEKRIEELATGPIDGSRVDLTVNDEPEGQ